MAKKKDKFPEFDPDDYPDYDPEEFEDIDEAMMLEAMFGGDDDFDMNAYWNEPDFLLADIVNMLVNIAGLEIGITLFVKGMTLTGVLTSEEKYLRDLTDTFRRRVHMKNSKGKMSKKDRKELDNMFDFTRLSETMINQELNADGAIPDGYPTVRFLHLKNPIRVGQGGVMNFGQGDVPYIRLRLSLIDGWMLGEIVSPDIFEDDVDSGEILH